MHPSLAPGESDFLVTNWLQLTNLGSADASGTLLFYDQAGAILRQETLELSAGNRIDFPGHIIGGGRIGTVEWRPVSGDQAFLFRNMRYLFDNRGEIESFNTAFQLEGTSGSGAELIVPVDTVLRSAVLELFNTTETAVVVSLRIVSPGVAPSGEIEQTQTLPPYGSLHLILDHVLGPIQQGYVAIQADTPRSVAAVAMQYGRRPDLGVSYMFGIPAKPALGESLRGSYNTYLGQDSWLVMVSPRDQQMEVRLSRPDGTSRYAGSRTVSGVDVLYLNQFEEPNNYGTVQVTPAERNTVVSWVLRARAEEYVLPTPLR
jgi:hypothetical protein